MARSCGRDLWRGAVARTLGWLDRLLGGLAAGFLVEWGVGGWVHQWLDELALIDSRRRVPRAGTLRVPLSWKKFSMEMILPTMIKLSMENIFQ